MNDKATISFEWLHGCSGCEIALLDGGEELITLFQQVEVVHFPLLMDHKHGQGDDAPLVPQADVGVVSGAVAHEDQLRLVQAMRSQCRILIALGTCATHGGIPAMRNQWMCEETMATVYENLASATDQAVASCTNGWLDRVYAVDEKVAVDFQLPGCPPRAERMLGVIRHALDGKKSSLPGKSVCETCPVVRKGSSAIASAKRALGNAAYDREQPIEHMQCLLEQGLLCMGPVTAGGCGGAEVPLCIKARVPCRGCYGPVQGKGNPLLGMMNALASNGVEHRTIVDRKSFLRFSGAHGRLKPPAAKQDPKK